MAYPVGKPAHNRLTEEQMGKECASRNHTLLELKHPVIKVRCHCGNEYEQKIHSYRAAKNSCKKCDSQRKSKPRPEHSRLMRENNPFKGKQHKPGIFADRINSWKPTPEQRGWPGELYLVRYLDKSGTHFKLGITYRGVQKRLGNKLISIIHLHKATLGECFDLEQELLRWAKDNGHRYSSPTTTELIHPAGLPYLLGRFTPLCLS
jgi:hypothetical protein